MNETQWPMKHNENNRKQRAIMLLLYSDLYFLVNLNKNEIKIMKPVGHVAFA